MYVGELMHCRDWPAYPEVVSECLILVSLRDLHIQGWHVLNTSSSRRFLVTQLSNLGHVTRLIGLHLIPSESQHNPHWEL